VPAEGEIVAVASMIVGIEVESSPGRLGRMLGKNDGLEVAWSLVGLPREKLVSESEVSVSCRASRLTETDPVASVCSAVGAFVTCSPNEDCPDE